MTSKQLATRIPAHTHTSSLALASSNMSKSAEITTTSTNHLMQGQGYRNTYTATAEFIDKQQYFQPPSRFATAVVTIGTRLLLNRQKYACFLTLNRGQ